MVTKVISGDSHLWTIPLEQIRNYREIPEGAQVSAFFNPENGDNPTDLAALREGKIIRIRLDPNVSSQLKALSGSLCLRFKTETFCKTVIVSEVSVVDLSESPVALKSEARRNYEAAKRALATYQQTRGAVKSYTIGTRSTTYNSVQDLIDLVEYWKKQVFLEECAADGGDRRTMLVRFV